MFPLPQAIAKNVKFTISFEAKLNILAHQHINPLAY